MDVTAVMDLVRMAMGVAIQLGAPILLLCLTVGVLVAVLQAVTQIHEQTIAFVLKMTMVVMVLMIGGGWMLETLQDLTRSIFAMIAAG